MLLLVYLERFSVRIDDVDGDLHVLLDALASPLEVSPLDGQVQVVADIPWDQQGTVTYLTALVVRTVMQTGGCIAFRHKVLYISSERMNPVNIMNILF